MKFEFIKLLPPENEVWGKVMFLHLSIILLTGGGGGLPDRAPPRTVTPHQTETPTRQRPPCAETPILL